MFVKTFQGVKKKLTPGCNSLLQMNVRIRKCGPENSLELLIFAEYFLQKKKTFAQIESHCTLRLGLSSLTTNIS